MKQIPDMENNPARALDSLDGIQRATPAPYFFTRLKARLAREEKDWGVIGFISRPAYALAMLCLVLCVNTWIVFKDTTDTTPVVPGFTTGSTGELPEQEYNVAVNTFYNYDTP